MQFTMVGANFRPSQARALVKELSIGDMLDLRRDEDNEYDENAIAVYSDDTHIGFVPKTHNSALAASMAAGAVYDAEVIAFESTLKPILDVDFAGESYGRQQDEAELR